MNNFVINKYLVFEFLKTFFNVILIFCCLGLILNLFEEINYFKNYDIGIGLPIILSLMIIPSIVINMLPFILFLSSMWVFIKLKNNRDILSLKTFGLSNINFLILFCFTAIFIGVVTLFAFTPITSIVVKYYEDIKGKYDLDKSHLASINSNGIWIREKNEEDVSIIKSEILEGDFLINVSIYKFDKNNSLISRIEGKQADISGNPWIVQNGFKIDYESESKREEFQALEFSSTFSKEKLSSIYSNLDTISFYNLITNMDKLIGRGYNPKLLNEKKHFYLSLPFFLVLMVCLAGIFTLNSNDRRQNTYYLILSIIVCVIVFYFKNFSTALGTTERIPLLISVWSPIIILSLFCSIGVIQINEK
mgnify:CR=1 FL=1|tara:strand:+ start:1072 stop:2160 length:1089 start_codon:yes stop_codon:yes gene_type:complete